MLAVLRHLGLSRAHFAARNAADYAELVTEHPDWVGSLALVCPPGLDVRALERVSDRLLLVHGDSGPNASIVPAVMSSLPSASEQVLSGYFDTDWSDVAADRTEEVGEGMVRFLARQPDIVSVGPTRETTGEVDGVSYSIEGTGPPLVLLPLALAPSQWEPLIPQAGATVHHYNPWRPPPGHGRYVGRSGWVPELSHAICGVNG